MITRYLFKKLQQRSPIGLANEASFSNKGRMTLEQKIFNGKIDWEKVLSTRYPKFTPDESEFIENELAGLLNLIHNQHDSPNESINDEMTVFLKLNGFFGLQIKKEFGGKAFSHFAVSHIISSITTRNIEVALAVMSANNFGPSELIQDYGTKEQQQTLLPKLANGEVIPCFIPNVQNTSLDYNHQLNFGTICQELHEGRITTGLKIQLDPELYNLEPETLIGAITCVKDPDEIFGEQINYGATCILIPTNLFKYTQTDKSTVLKYSRQEVGEPIFIPLTMVIGESNGLGKAIMMVRGSKQSHNTFTPPKISPAINQIAYKNALELTKLKSLSDKKFTFAYTRDSIVEIAIKNLSSSSLRKLTLSTINNNKPAGTLIAISQNQTPHLAHKAYNLYQTIDQTDTRYLNYHLKAPSIIELEGGYAHDHFTNLWVGTLLNTHPQFLNMLSAIQGQNQKDSYKKFKNAFKGFTSNFLRKYFNANPVFTNENIAAKHSLTTHINELDRLSKELAFINELAAINTSAIKKDNEHTMGRLGEIFTNIIMAIALVIDFSQNRSELNLYKIAIIKNLERVDHLAKQLTLNSSKLVGHCSKYLRVQKHILEEDTDQLRDKLIRNLSGSEHHLTEFICSGTDEEPGGGRFSKALKLKFQNEKLYKKISEAQEQNRLPTSATISQLIKLASQLEILSKEEVESITIAEEHFKQSLYSSSINK